MNLIRATEFMRTPPGLAALDALVSVGYAQDLVRANVEIAYRNGIPRRTTIGAIAYTNEQRKTEDASVIVHPVEDLKQCRWAIEALAVIPAPFFLLHDNRVNSFRIWAATTDFERKRIPREITREAISPDRLKLALKDFRRDLNPQTVTDVRLGRAKFHSEAFKQIDPLQLLLLSEEANESTIVQHFGHALDEMRHGPFSEDRAGELALQLLAWRILVDKKVLPDSTNIRDIYLAAQAEGLESYFTWTDREEAHTSFRQVANMMRGLVFDAFEVDMLRAIYQRTFTRETTRHLGRFDTPLWLTRRIIEHIPFENISPKKRHIVDMTCGWGSFLVAGYDRLKNMPDTHKPRNLVRHIHGNEMDPLTANLARLALLLESGHNTWAVNHGDALQWERLKPNSQSVIVGNPPFRTESGAASRSDYAFEFLDKAISALAPDGYIGMIMPASFEIKEAGGQARERLLKEIDVMDLWRLPGQIFKGTPERVTVMIGRKRRTTNSIVRIQETASGSHERFLLRQGIATATNFANAKAWIANSTFTAGRSPSKAVFKAYAILDKPQWDNLSKRQLGDVAHVIYGLPQGSSDKTRQHPSHRTKQEYYLKINKQAVKPFCLDLSERKKINFPDDLQEPGLGKKDGSPSKYELMQCEKTVMPSTLRQDWGQIIPAAVDRSGTLFSNNFWCFVPREEAIKEGITAPAIAVILNWWVANGWIAEHRQFPAPNAAVIRQIPFPRFTNKTFWAQITAYGIKCEKQKGTIRSAEIDAAMMQGYGMSEDDIIERLRDVFQWKSVKQKGTVDKQPQLPSETLLVSGHITQVDAVAKTLTAWVDYAGAEITLPMASYIPGWALRTGARFSAAASINKKGKISSVQNIKPEQYGYLSDNELSDEIAHCHKLLNSSQ